MTHGDLQKAMHILGLADRCTLSDIKAHHRDLVKRHHPDSGNAADPEMMAKVNAAYELVLAYVSGYRFSFGEAEFYEQNPDERLRRQFMDTPFWSKG